MKKAPDTPRKRATWPKHPSAVKYPANTEQVDVHLKLDAAIYNWLADFTAQSGNQYFGSVEVFIAFLIRSTMDKELFEAVDPALLHSVIEQAKIPIDFDDDIPF